MGNTENHAAGEEGRLINFSVLPFSLEGLIFKDILKTLKSGLSLYTCVK